MKKTDYMRYKFIELASSCQGLEGGGNGVEGAGSCVLGTEFQFYG